MRLIVQSIRAALKIAIWWGCYQPGWHQELNRYIEEFTQQAR
jgi:hypothetical protein